MTLLMLLLTYIVAYAFTATFAYEVNDVVAYAAVAHVVAFWLLMQLLILLPLIRLLMWMTRLLIRLLR